MRLQAPHVESIYARHTYFSIVHHPFAPVYLSSGSILWHAMPLMCSTESAHLCLPRSRTFALPSFHIAEHFRFPTHYLASFLKTRPIFHKNAASQEACRHACAHTHPLACCVKPASIAPRHSRCTSTFRLVSHLLRLHKKIFHVSIPLLMYPDISYPHVRQHNLARE